MTSRLTSVRFTPARTGGGLLGWASFVLDGDVRVDGLAVRRTLHGELTCSWPGRRGAGGRLHHHVWPIDDAARLRLEGELLAHLHPFLRGSAA